MIIQEENLTGEARVHGSEMLLERAQRLPTPLEMRERFPLNPETAMVVEGGKEDLIEILTGRDNRLSVVLGPCGLSHINETLDFAETLAKAQGDFPHLQMIMRLNGEKPRTAVGWGGMLVDPDMNGSMDVAKGIATVRDMYTSVLGMGLPVSAEMLDPNLSPFLSDLMSFNWVGARNIEDQNTRRAASASPMPVGLKNPTNGHLPTLVNALKVASAPNAVLTTDVTGRPIFGRTPGNANSVAILRGTEMGPNCDEDSIASLALLLGNAGLPQRVIIDAAHGNCLDNGKKSVPGQVRALTQTAKIIGTGNQIVRGVMLEAMLQEGQTITDPVMGIENVMHCLEMLNNSVEKRRNVNLEV